MKEQTQHEPGIEDDTPFELERDEHDISFSPLGSKRSRETPARRRHEPGIEYVTPFELERDEHGISFSPLSSKRSRETPILRRYKSGREDDILKKLRI